MAKLRFLETIVDYIILSREGETPRRKINRKTYLSQMILKNGKTRIIGVLLTNMTVRLIWKAAIKNIYLGTLTSKKFILTS